MHQPCLVILPLLLLLASIAKAINLDVNSRESILHAASLTALDVRQLYKPTDPGGKIGKFPFPPYYWWESGAAWGAMIEYYHYTGDKTHLNTTLEAILSQLGPRYDFELESERFDEGNDDQAFWVFAAMSAAEYSLPQPPAPIPPWIRIAQNAWESFASRWMLSTGCNGGLKWQFHAENAGWYYKSTISNGCFFQLSARLARFTGNDTYLHWANRIWDWSEGVGLIDSAYNVYDGTDELINCSAIDHHQWSYNVGVYLYGAASLQNYTRSRLWLNRTLGLLDSVNTFVTPFPNSTNIIVEAACELNNKCNTDQLSMKAYLARWLAATCLVAPFTAPRIGEILRTSAQGAAASCTGGPYSKTCGSKWFTHKWDGTSGLGQQLAAMEVIYALLVNETDPPANDLTVTIEPAPSVSLTATASANPHGTARPLHDAAEPPAKYKNKIHGFIAAVVTALALF
ncbi:hypothetical protein B0A52_00912 [Exophiala mesophila]|uniref:Mannan endo-1,6-alpha-mannosidase n=1 Tax=Exophiala mesophila TaxID=212818 RepID=A0A438NIK6_EXOME|nr:hypothetical protein B0A52_00912 [Exophiala mesophila]